MAALQSLALELSDPVFQIETVQVEPEHATRYDPPSAVPGVEPVLEHDFDGYQAVKDALPSKHSASGHCEATVAVVPAGSAGVAEVYGTIMEACIGGEVMVVPTLVAALLEQSSTIDPPAML